MGYRRQGYSLPVNWNLSKSGNKISMFINNVWFHICSHYWALSLLLPPMSFVCNRVYTYVCVNVCQVVWVCVCVWCMCVVCLSGFLSVCVCVCVSVMLCGCPCAEDISYLLQFVFSLSFLTDGTYHKLGYYDYVADNLTWFNAEKWIGKSELHLLHFHIASSASLSQSIIYFTFT